MNWNELLSNQVNPQLPQRVRNSWICRNDRHLTFNNSTTQMLNFTSNNYLGLAFHPEVIYTCNQASSEYGIGSTGAQTLSGYCNIQMQLEQDIAKWLGYDGTLIFPSGYQLNIALLATIAKASKSYKPHIWLDKNCHASIIDSIHLSKCHFTTFTLQTIDQTVDKINNMPSTNHIIVTEGVFSMDGSCNYLNKLINLKQHSPNNTLIILDDSHGIGITGKNGRGSLELIYTKNTAINNPIDILIGTFSKAFGTHGGFLSANHTLIKYLEQNCRSFIFSSALPPAILSATAKSLSIIQSDEGALLRTQLRDIISQFKQQFNSMIAVNSTISLNILNQSYNNSQIQLIECQSLEQLQKLYSYLISKNILTGKIFYPTVAKNKYRLRLSFNTSHTYTDIFYLMSSILKYFS